MFTRRLNGLDGLGSETNSEEDVAWQKLEGVRKLIRTVLLGARARIGGYLSGNSPRQKACCLYDEHLARNRHPVTHLHNISFLMSRAIQNLL